jgi:cysteine desulfurase/selenocysteine lyase
MTTRAAHSCALDAAALRQDFPILALPAANGLPLAYLDSAATTQKPHAVLQAMDSYYHTTNANVHRGAYRLAEDATALYEGARARVAALIGAPEVEQVIFTRNATEALNLVALSWGRANLRPGDLIVCTEMEHHSNLVPWQMLAAATGAELAFVPFDPNGYLELDALEDLLRRGPRLLAMTAVSNVLGTRNPLAQIVNLAHAAGTLVVIDAAQAVAHHPLDVAALDADWLAFSGHKMYGPTGIGVLYGRRALLEAMPPVLGGGDMIRRVRLQGSTWNDLPWKFEAGTPPIAEAIGLGAAADYLLALGTGAVEASESQTIAYALQKLQELPGVTVYGPPDVRDHGSAISFSLPNIHPHDVASLLDERGIAIRAGHHCAQPLHDRLGVAATARASIAVHTTHQEIDRLVDGLREVQHILGGHRHDGQ